MINGYICYFVGPTLKVKRCVVNDMYGKEIEAMYSECVIRTIMYFFLVVIYTRYECVVSTAYQVI